MEFSPNETIYASSPLPSNTQRNFLKGPGEGLPFPSVALHFEGVIRVEGAVLRLSISLTNEFLHLNARVI